MPHDFDQLNFRIGKLEEGLHKIKFLLYGPDGETQKGIAYKISKVHEISEYNESIRDKWIGEYIATQNDVKAMKESIKVIFKKLDSNSMSVMQVMQIILQAVTAIGVTVLFLGTK